MLKYTVRRIVYMIPILFGISLVTFLLFNVAGGDPAATAAGRYANAQQIALMKAQLGLDKPMWQQYLNFIGQIATLDFGYSWSTKQKISTLFWAGVGPSLSITGPAFFLSLCITIPLGLLLAYFRNTTFDKTTMVICLGLVSISSLVYVLACQYFFAYKMGWFPISGWDNDWIDRWQFTYLPIIILIILTVGTDLLFYRTVFIEEIHQDYVRTARSKGLSNRRILLKHVLGNSLVPIITMVILEIPLLITGTLLIESFFGIPGLGGLIYQAIENADFPVIKAITVISAILYMIFQLLSDLLYAVVDPKIRLG
jgi:peptide/nickel transport system permease protein